MLFVSPSLTGTVFSPNVAVSHRHHSSSEIGGRCGEADRRDMTDHTAAIDTTLPAT